jgi:hypothetical protein
MQVVTHTSGAVRSGLPPPEQVVRQPHRSARLDYETPSQSCCLAPAESPSTSTTSLAGVTETRGWIEEPNLQSAYRLLSGAMAPHARCLMDFLVQIIPATDTVWYPGRLPLLLSWSSSQETTRKLTWRDILPPTLPRLSVAGRKHAWN